MASPALILGGLELGRPSVISRQIEFNHSAICFDYVFGEIPQIEGRAASIVGYP